MASEELLFKKIDDPSGFRRNILEASKQMIHGLQKFERLKAVRSKKAEHVARLRNIVREISTLNAKLKKEFPDIIFKRTQVKKEKKEPKEKAAKKGKKGEAKEEKGKKESRELVDLERQLKDIEKKLESVS